MKACFTPLSEDERKAQGFTPVCINEVSAANGIYVNDYFKRNDWIELYNTTDAVVDVAGMYVSDNLDKPRKYQIPTDLKGVSTKIPAHGFLIVWCDKLDPLTQLHASFKIDDDGGDILLTAKDESWSNRLTYARHKSDETVGRYPDGSANVLVMNIPTIAKPNITSSYTVEVQQPASSGIQDLLASAPSHLSIRYLSGRLVCCCATATNLPIRITNLAGQQIASLPASLQGGYAEVSVGQLPAGIYIASITDSMGHKATCKFIKH